MVQAVVDAINARDAELVGDLSTPGFSEYVEDTWMDGGYLTYAEIGNVVEDHGAGTAYPDAVGVMVSFIPEGTDASMDDGERITWTFGLTDDSGRWLVFDAGTG